MEKNIIFSLNHSPINVHFSKNHKDFIVRERPLYEFSGEGEHAVILIQKKDLSTSEAIKILSNHSGLKQRDFSYAGLKDKEGLTFQHISFLHKYLGLFENFIHEKMKIVKVFRHDNKLRIGHLKGNSFFIRLKKVSKIDAMKLENAFKTLCKQGFANYFGYQRFGKYQDNARSGEELLKRLLKGEKPTKKNKRLNDFLCSAYQSELFNEYLSKRIGLSHFFKEFNKNEFQKIYPFIEYDLLKKQSQFFKMLEGEILGHYPFGKCFLCEDLLAENIRFKEKDITPMGPLVGKKELRLTGCALEFAKDIFSDALLYENFLKGSLRPLISFIHEGKFEYNEEKAHFSLEFYLQKGSYATVVLEELLCSKLR